MDASRGFVLVIDEDERIRETTARWFEEQGYRVARANGETGVHMARSDRPDVILLDAEMPSRRGYETLERLKFDPTTREIPVVVSAQTNSDSIRLAVVSRIDDLLRRRMVGSDPQRQVAPSGRYLKEF